MSLQLAAQHLKAHGRGPDDQLVHMTSNEVKGLRALANAKGGDLSINPNTGLPEAGFLDDILPAVVGIGLDMFAPGLGEAVGGAFGLSGAAGTGILTGGLTGLATGNLGKGLMAGLGAYGGAGLAENFMGAGKEALMKNASDMALQQQNLLTGGNPVDTAKQLINQMPNIDSTVKQGLFSGLESGVDPNQILTSASQANAALGATPEELSKAGLNAITNAPGQFLKSNVKNIGMAAAPLIAGLGTQQPSVSPMQPYTGPLSKYHLSPDFKAAEPVRPSPYYVARYPNYVTNPYSQTMMAAGGPIEMNPGGLAGADTRTMYPQSQQDHTQFATPTQMPTSAQIIQSGYEAKTDPYTGTETVAGFKSGGIASFARGGDFDYLPSSPSIPSVGIFHDTDVDTAKKDALTAALIKNKKAFAAANLKAGALPKTRLAGLGDISGQATEIEGAAAGGSIGGYSDGGRMLKGPGDGMSDSIPATISNKQPARLADGEFVVPADVVSHLGNGSTDAGAKRLYAMMDNVRKARTGRKKQAPAVKADKYLPK